MSYKAHRTHMVKVGGARAVCRYVARPSRKVHAVDAAVFAKTPLPLRCAECQRAFAKATGSQQ